MKPDRCPHCNRRRRHPGLRGLCQPCHRDPAVRALYPLRRAANPQASRRAENRNSRPAAPRVFASREERLAELTARAERHESLVVPGDATLDGVPAEEYDPGVLGDHVHCGTGRGSGPNKAREKKYRVVLRRRNTTQG